MVTASRLIEIELTSETAFTRQHEPKPRSAFRRVDLEAATMRASDRFRNEQSETEALAAAPGVTA